MKNLFERPPVCYLVLMAGLMMFTGCAPSKPSIKRPKNVDKVRVSVSVEPPLVDNGFLTSEALIMAERGVKTACLKYDRFEVADKFESDGRYELATYIDLLLFDTNIGRLSFSGQEVDDLKLSGKIELERLYCRISINCVDREKNTIIASGNSQGEKAIKAVISAEDVDRWVLEGLSEREKNEYGLTEAIEMATSGAVESLITQTDVRLLK